MLASCLSAVIRDSGYEPVLLDLNTRRTQCQPNPHAYCEQLIIDTLKQYQPQLVGVSFLFSGVFAAARKVAQLVKACSPMVPIITGGIHASSFPGEILNNCSEFDYIALGEGEAQIVQLANILASGNLENLSSIQSFAYRRAEGGIVINTERMLLDYAKMPRQAWDLIDFSDYESDLSNYFNPKKIDMKTIVPLISERGCPYRCNFCSMYLIQGRKIRRRTPQQFVDEIAYLVNERGQRYFSFMDDNLTLDNRHIISICREIVSRGLDIQFETTGGLCVNTLSDEVIDAMVDAGMISALLAPEHGSEYIRNSVIGKNLQTDKIFSVVAKLQSHKILLGANWIMGFPEETIQTLGDMMAMINSLKVDKNWVGSLIPFPGTRVFEQCVRDNLFNQDVDLTQLWHTPIRAHQGHCIIKPYALDMETLEDWRQRFDKVRYKWFGHFHPDFRLPKGYTRVAGEVLSLDSLPLSSLGEGRTNS